MIKSLQQRRNEFAVSIRRDNLQKKFKELRHKHFQAVTEQRVDTIIEGFGLKQDAKFVQEVIKDEQVYQFRLVEVLLRREESLVRIAMKPGEMLDEKLVPPAHNAIQVQDTPLPKQYPFQLQTALYDSISHDIYHNQGKYSKMPKPTQQKLITFFIRFLKRNTYLETALNKAYHSSIINCLELLVTQIQSPDLRETVFLWVNGCEALRLIYNCLPGTFMSCVKYERIYKIVLTGLKSQKLDVRIQALDVLYRSVRHGDYDDVGDLLDRMSQIVNQVMVFFNSLEVEEAMYKVPQVMNAVRKAACCLIMLLETYQSDIVDLLRQGAGQVGAKLICENDIELIVAGLTIMQHVVNIQDRSLSKEAIELIFESPSINEYFGSINIWKRLADSALFLNSTKLQLKRAYVGFVSSFVIHADYDDIVKLFFKLEDYNCNLLQVIINMFMLNDDNILLSDAILVFQSLMYYSGQLQEQDIEKEPEMGNNNHQTKDTLKDNEVFYTIRNQGVLDRMQKIINEDTMKGIYSEDLKLKIEDFFIQLKSFQNDNKGDCQI